MLPDGSLREYERGQVTPLDIAKTYSRDSYKKYIIALLDNVTLWDMSRPLEHGGSISFLDFDSESEEARKVFWHSSAHVLGAALENVYGDNMLLCDGPALSEGGFFYEFLLLKEKISSMPSIINKSSYSEQIDALLANSGHFQFISDQNFPSIKKNIDTIVSQKHTFERITVDPAIAKSIFRYNPFKLHFIDRAINFAHSANPNSRPKLSLYRCGNTIDLCQGPHVVHTAQLRAFRLNKVSSAHWVTHRSQEAQNQQHAQPLLNRVYGISFPTAEKLKSHEKFLAEAVKRDHRQIGKSQKAFHDTPMGSWVLLSLCLTVSVLSTGWSI